MRWRNWEKRLWISFNTTCSQEERGLSISKKKKKVSDVLFDQNMSSFDVVALRHFILFLLMFFPDSPGRVFRMVSLCRWLSW